MALGDQSPSFELTTFGIGKETVFATSVSPTIWLAPSDLNMAPKNDMIDRPGARGRISMSYPSTAGFSGSGSMTVEATPDVLGPILSLAMGSETVTANAANGGATPLAYDHVFLLDSPLDSFTAQWFRRTDTTAYAGNMVSSLRFSMSQNQILMAQIATQYARQTTGVTPGTPSYGTVDIFRYIDPLNSVKINGVTGAWDIKAFEINLATGIAAGDKVFGGGRIDTKYNQTQAKVSGSATLKFNTIAAEQLFLGAVGANSPQSTVAPVSLEFFFGHPANINTNVKYGCRFLMANCFLETSAVPGRGGGFLEQTVNFSAAETVGGAHDDLKVTLTNSSSGAY